jgi:hypothetical protein
MGQSESEVPIVRHDKEPLCGSVQASHRKDPGLSSIFGEQIQNNRTPLRVVTAGDVSGRFVEHTRHGQLGPADDLAVDLHTIPSGIDFRTRDVHDDSVDSNSPFHNEFVAPPSGRYSRPGKEP